MQLEVYDLKKHPVKEFFDKIKDFFKGKKKKKKEGEKKENEIIDLTKHNIEYIKK
jgi:hypothetical protein